MLIFRRPLRAFLLAFPLALTISTSALAQVDTWPSKPVRIIVPANAGGGTADPVSRVFAEELTKLLKQRVYVENRGGSNGNIGASLAAKSAPDGYTVLFSWAGTLATNISLYKQLQFHPVNDFEPVALIGGVSNVLVVNTQFPAANLKEFSAYVKSKPGQLNYASSGNGSSMHLAAELYKKQTQSYMVHVPYNNVGQATGDLISNQVQLMFHLITGAQGAIKSGQVKALAVLAPQRSPVLPDVPTMKELGMPIESQTWFALLMPKGTPSDIVRKLNEAANKVLNDPAVRQRLMAMGLEPAGGGPEILKNHLNAEIVKWAEVIKYSGAKLE
jgi:tripartite-type tricarboxylate transporter receptor subunit TctC